VLKHPFTSQGRSSVKRLKTGWRKKEEKKVVMTKTAVSFLRLLHGDV
jgi:hypothetical protein